MILAGAALLHYAGAPRRRASRAIYEAVLETVAAGIRTPDLGGHAGTTEFTDAVIAASRASSSLGDGSDRDRISAQYGGRSAGTSAERRLRGARRCARTGRPASRARPRSSILAVARAGDDRRKGLHDVAQRGLNGLSTGAIYALGAVGLTLVYGILKLVNFAHGDFLTFGAYMAFLVNVTLGLPLVVGDLLRRWLRRPLLGVLLEQVMWGPMRAQAAPGCCSCC